MELDNRAIAMLFEVKKNQLKMVERRGYNIDRERSLLQITSQDFKNAYIPFAEQNKTTLRGVLTQVYEKDDGEKLVVYFSDVPAKSSQLGIEPVSDAIAEMDARKTRNGIIITAKSLSPSSKKHLERLINYNIQVFLESEMGYDPTEHYLTPEHRALSVEEQRKFLVDNNLSIDKIPIILDTDMIARYYGFKPGQVIEIKRTNMYDTMIQKSVSYRAVKDEV